MATRTAGDRGRSWYRQAPYPVTTPNAACSLTRSPVWDWSALLAVKSAFVVFWCNTPPFVFILNNQANISFKIKIPVFVIANITLTNFLCQHRGENFVLLTQDPCVIPEISISAQKGVSNVSPLLGIPIFLTEIEVEERPVSVMSVRGIEKSGLLKFLE